MFFVFPYPERYMVYVYNPHHYRFLAGRGVFDGDRKTGIQKLGNSCINKFLAKC